jgi:hypothetical protein
MHPKKPLRDIYYIILDGYARADVLRDYYGYDNSEFIRQLESRGFYVAPESRSSSQYTCYSLTESLNFNRLDALRKSVGARTMPVSLLDAMIRNNKASLLLKRMGYTFVFFSSGWQVTRMNPNADITYLSGSFNLSEFDRALLLDSPFHAVVKGSHRKQVLHAFQMLGTVPEIKKPTFTFAHIICPHEPMIFDRNGNQPKQAIVVERKESPAEMKSRYVDQLIYTNKRIVGIIDGIIAQSDVKPIIILQSDHGYRPGVRVLESRASSMESKDLAAERDRILHGILNAYCLPDGGDKLLYSRVSPANSFRIVFNHYFGADYELLSDDR